MREARYFYVPQAGQRDELPSEEARHAVRVLRLVEGDEIFLIDGAGSFLRCTITLAAPHHSPTAWRRRRPSSPRGAAASIWLLPRPRTWDAWSGWRRRPPRWDGTR